MYLCNEIKADNTNTIMLTRLRNLFQFRLALPTLLLAVGLFLFLSCIFNWFDLDNQSGGFKLMEKAGDLILISSIISFLIDSAEYLGIFKRELEEVIYDTKFLRKRNDIDTIWVKVSDVLFQSKFPQISSRLMMAVKNYYAPDENLKLNYYNDYRNIYTISYDEEDHDIICVENRTSYILSVEDSNGFTFPMRYWNCVEEDNQESVETLMGSVTVNGEPVNDIGEPVKTYKDGMVCYSFELKLKGSNEYRIQQVIRQKYNLKEDNYLGFRARWLVNNMRIQVFHPADMKLLFVNRATAKGFEVNNDTETFKEYEYKGLILKHQGYIIILNRP